MGTIIVTRDLRIVFSTEFMSIYSCNSLFGVNRILPPHESSADRTPTQGLLRHGEGTSTTNDHR
jgi:hypothetical protein